MKRALQGVVVLALIGTGTAFLAGWPTALIVAGCLLLLDLLT